MISKPDLTMDSELGDAYVQAWVKNPILHKSWDDGQYVSYGVQLETKNFAFTFPKSVVRRRYSEFIHLRKLLKAQHPTIEPPPLPSKAIFVNKSNPRFIEHRRQGLELFLQTVLRQLLYLSNRSLHLFAQSNLPMEHVERIVDGNTDRYQKTEPHLCMYPMLVPSADSDTPSTSYPERFRNDDATDNNPVVKKVTEKDGIKCHRLEAHSHVTLGSRITVCSPSLHVPQPSDHHNLRALLENEAAGSFDSDYSSAVENSSPAWERTVMTNGILSSRTNSRNNSIHGSPARKKKVSFNSEVTVAHLLI